MLFTFPSQYWFAIGLPLVFSLAGWSRLFQTGFLVPRPTQDLVYSNLYYAYRALTFCGRSFLSVLLLLITIIDSPSTPHWPQPTWFGLFPVRSPLLGKSLLFSLPPLTEMFQFGGFAPDYSGNALSVHWVAPFGDLGVIGYVRLAPTFRSLSRPSSPAEA